MPQVAVPGDIDLEYETFGDPADPTVLLIAQDFGAQMLSWDGASVMGSAGVAGRDSVRQQRHRSTKLDRFPSDLGELIGAASSGDLETVRALAPYRLEDLADDAAGLVERRRSRPGPRRRGVDGGHGGPTRRDPSSRSRSHADVDDVVDRALRGGAVEPSKHFAR